MRDSPRPDINQRTLKRGVKKLRREGVQPFISSSVNFLIKYIRFSVTERAKDRIVRDFLDDAYMLPVHLRRVPGYWESRRTGYDKYKWIRSHTCVNLNDSVRVADIGCGDGQVAREFVEFHPELDYVGFDINETRIQALSSRYDETPYNFHHQDIYNELYNPKGEIAASEYVFPFDSDSFDLMWANSLFTHLFPSEAENYLEEIERLLKPGGEAWLTWFLLSEDRDDFVFNKSRERGGGNFEQKYQEGRYEYYSIHESDPVRTIGYHERTVEDMISEMSLEINKTILGYWRDEAMFSDIERHSQDVIVFKYK